MKHIVIRNIGPLTDVDIYLKKYNVIIGPQSSGKSCVLKIASFCFWLEKRIELIQDTQFVTRSFIDKALAQYHKMSEFIRPDSFLTYESDTMKYSYDFSKNKFFFEWKNRWSFHRPEISYIPSERNLVAVIPNWYEVNFEDNNILDFMAHWETARKATPSGLPILNLGISYHYDKAYGRDLVTIPGGSEDILFTNSSSGLQALIPLVVYLNYLTTSFNATARQSLQSKGENENLLNVMYHIFGSKSKTYEFKQLYQQYITADHYHFFVEEPENSLFPPTQKVLIEWMMELVAKHEGDSLFVATHSPYILNAFLEHNDLSNIGVFLTDASKSVVKTASEEDVQEMYDYGGDFFFNIQSLL